MYFYEIWILGSCTSAQCVPTLVTNWAMTQLLANLKNGQSATAACWEDGSDQKWWQESIITLLSPRGEGRYIYSRSIPRLVFARAPCPYKDCLSRYMDSHYQDKAIYMSLEGLIDIMSALVQMKARHRASEKPLSDLMMNQFINAAPGLNGFRVGANIQTDLFWKWFGR